MNSFALRRTCSGASAPLQNAGGNSISSSGEYEARFRSVVLPHLADAYVLAGWLTSNRADAEEVVQDACLRAFRKMGNFSNGNARVWVLTIVRRTAYDWVNTNGPATLVPVDALEPVTGAQSGELDTLETALIAEADAGLLRAAIARLPVPFRETLVMRDLQGLAYREIAEVTEVPVGRVMSRLARARHRLMTIIAEAEA